MTVIVGPQRASPELLAPLAEIISSRTSYSGEDGEVVEHYVVDNVQKSESAWILFTHKEVQTEERYVIKLLCPYKDQRYDLSSAEQRRTCQAEALTFNKTFSPDVYLGLANAYQLQPQQARLTIGQPTHTTTKLGLHTEYALVMHQLPKENRLDFLLEHTNTDILSRYIPHIVQRIVEIHTTAPALSLEEGRRWGSFENLKVKLKHNLSLAAPLLEHHDLTLWKRFSALRKDLQQVLVQDRYDEYFEDRVKNNQIKHCHGDLKGPNIWIEPNKGTLDNHRVTILDAIDFNPMYSNIDTLSDLATLIVDIQTRLLSTDFADKLPKEMIEQYLSATNQYQDQGAREVLHYYLVEKAFVGAAISLVYDDLPELGMRFLQVAETYWTRYFIDSRRKLPGNLQHKTSVPLKTPVLVNP